jgi:hypothetical protein
MSLPSDLIPQGDATPPPEEPTDYSKVTLDKLLQSYGSDSDEEPPEEPEETPPPPPPPPPPDEPTGDAELMAQVTREIAEALRSKNAPPPASAPVASAPPPPVTIPKITDEQIIEISRKHGADEPTARAIVELMEPLISQIAEAKASEQTRGLALGARETSIERSLATDPLPGVAAADILAIMDAEGVSDQEWAQGAPEVRQRYLGQWRDAALGAAVRSGKYKPTASPAPAPIPPKATPGTAVNRPASAHVSEPDDSPGFDVLVSQLRGIGMGERVARNRAREIIQEEVKKRKAAI